MKKRLLSVLLAAVMLLGLLVVPAGAEAAGATLTAGGWFETICAELTGVTDSDVTAVAYAATAYADGSAVSGGDAWTLTGDDFTYLVRDMTGGVRIDIPGVKAGTYTLTVTAGGKDYVARDIEVKAYDRSGFAHKVHTVDGENNITGIQNYTEGVGAYNDDGTLKENAIVLYVTDENKDSVELSVYDPVDKAKKTAVGIGNILNTKGYKDTKAPKIFYSCLRANAPVAIRMVGNVKTPMGVSVGGSTSFGGATDDNGSMCTVQNARNLTIEGIGPDADLEGWGICLDGSGTGDSSYRNYEVRNLSFRNVPEDCIGIQGKASGGKLTEPVDHTWVHNCSFYAPHDIPDYSSEGDKGGGDGACDFKCGRYHTMDYCYYQGYHKTNLVGSGSSDRQFHVTWHHNWWDHCESRGPLSRNVNIHIYNCFYDNQSSYCQNTRNNAYIFSEYNTFKSCKDVAKIESGGAPIKSYMDTRENCKGLDHATKVQVKTETVSGSGDYVNFDTNATVSYIPNGDYALETDMEKAMADVRANAGVMKLEPDVPGYVIEQSGTLTSDAGNLDWIYTEDGQVVIFGDIDEDESVFVAAYDGTGGCTAVKKVAAGKAMLGADAVKAKLFWLNDVKAPKCENGEF